MKSETCVFQEDLGTWNKEPEPASAAQTSVEIQGFDPFFVAGCAGKVCYRNEAAARRVLKRIEQRAKRRGAKGRQNTRKADVAYRCEFCGSWHTGRKAGK